MFEIRKGTEQGDPLSSLLFNTVLQYALKDELTRWQEESKGIRLRNNTSDCLTNLRFADDVLLFSTSLSKLKDMPEQFKRSTDKVGLEIHPNKTKNLSNQTVRRQKEVEIDNIKIAKKKRAPSILDKKITFEQQETAEIRNRIRRAWAAFFKFRQELTSKTYRYKDRLRLFDMVITPTLTYSCATWTLTKEHERMIKSTQRKVLRLIIQTKKKYKQKSKKEEDKVEGPRIRKTKMMRKNRTRKQTREKHPIQIVIKTAIEDSDNAQDEPEIEE